MGFAVSGSFAVLAVATFVAFGMVYSSTAFGVELVRHAEHDAQAGQLARQNTAIELTAANWTGGSGCDSSGSCLLVSADNVGTTSLEVSATDLLVDGQFVPADRYANATVNNDSTTDLWLPGETYHIEVNASTLSAVLGGHLPPKRVKLVTDHGVSTTQAVA